MTDSRPIQTLADVAARLHTAGLTQGGPDPAFGFRAVKGDPPNSPVAGIARDSRSVTPGTVFVAIAGLRHDGAAFARDAAERGASAVISEAPTEGLPIPCLTVSSARRALLELASAFHGDPWRGLPLIAVTGTNGKTTTAWLIAQGLTLAGVRSGFLGTIGYGTPDNLDEATHTTPDPVVLQEWLARFRDQGFGACAIEASSHAIDQHRVAGSQCAAAVFTNLTRDHLDYHGDLDAYLEAKASLFADLPGHAMAVINTDDPAGDVMAERTSAHVVRFGQSEHADIRYTVKSDHGSGLSMRIDGHDAGYRLSGFFNGSNLAAAYAAMAAVGIPAPDRIRALTRATAAPGRFEVVPLGRDRTGVVDYAHTPDALRNVLEAARRMVSAGASLWVVFGCGGDRDQGKRPLMGGIAEALSDRVVVTSDNPRSENPELIMEDVRAGFRKPKAAHWITDREEAIALAVQSSGVGDVVVVAGKGHEPYQVIGEESLPFSDITALRRAAGV